MLRNALSNLFSWVVSLLIGYRIGSRYWWDWIGVIFGYVDAKVIYSLRGVLKTDHWGTERSVDGMAGDSDTLFVMGSGASVNDIADDEWEIIERAGEVMSFNYFFRGEFVPIDYHLVRETDQSGFPKNMSLLTSRSKVREYWRGILSNSCYEDCAFFALKQPIMWRERAPAFVIWSLYFEKYLAGHSVCFYQNGDREFPGENIEDVSHVGATLTDAINLGYLMGYDEIVLVGVDLYNRKYFWFDEEDERREVDERRGADADERHRTAPTMVDTMAEWETYLGERGVSLCVENPRSLLHTEAGVPVYEYPEKELNETGQN